MTGELFVDGVRVDPAWLARTVSRTGARIEALAAGGAVRVGGDPVAIVVATLASQATGVPLLFAGAAPDPSCPVGPRAVVRRAGTDIVVDPVGGAGGVELPARTGAIFRTSGSSGEPKHVALSWSALDYQAEATSARLGITGDDALCVPLPLHHAYGFSILRIWQLASPRLHVETAFRPDRIAHLVRTAGVTSLDGVPSMYASLLRHTAAAPDLAERLGRLRIRGCGGDVLPGRLQREFLDRTGAPIHDGYGLTEAGPNVAISGPGTWRPGAVGPPLPGTEVAVSARGELLVRGPGVMLEYLGDPAASAQTVDPDGWLHTGDLATIGGDGYVTVHGRLKDVLVVHGETFAPTDVEMALGGCAGVVEAGVVAVHSGQVRGDRILAFVVSDAAAPAEATAASVRQEVRRKLPAQLRPSDIRLVPALPRLASGKIDRQELRRWGAAA